MKVELFKWPGLQEIGECKMVALATVGKNMVNKPTNEWLVRIADAQHSPIRELRFLFEIEAPYWVLNELRTHHVGCEMYMQSSRNDRQKDFDRTHASQGMTRKAFFSCNLQSLIDICHKRLCTCASNEMRQLAGMMKERVVSRIPWTNELLVPMCVYRNGCHEMNPCGRYTHEKE